MEVKGVGRSVVFCHGFGGSARNFRPQLRALSDHYRVVAYDTRGHARSAAPTLPEDYDFERLVDDFERVAETEDGSPVVAAGLSLGAVTALAFAVRWPERVHALVLASLPGAATARGPWAAAFADAIEAEGLEAAGARFVWGARSRFDPAGAALIKRGLMEHPPHALVAILRRALAALPSVPGLAADVACPVLVISGGEDTAALAEVEEVLAVAPHVEQVTIPNAGHVVNLAAPEAFNARVRAFLDANP